MTNDIVWTACMTLVVFFMHAGFGFFESGMCRSKNTVDTLTHNVVILVMTILVFWLFGFGLMFGAGNPFAGTTGFAPRLGADQIATFPSLAGKTVPLAISFAFAAAYADTPATLIAGSGAERIKLIAVLLLTLVISGVVFPVTGHWVLGAGWLAHLRTPVYDTGAGTVQLCGGACALAVALVLGPRRHRFDNDGDKAFGVSSMPNTFLGAFTLWLGFFAFNAGFAMHASRAVGLIILNTALATCAGTTAAFFTSWALTRKAELRGTLVALLTANVAVTSAASVIEPWAAITTGALAGLAAVASTRGLARLRVDDPTEYVTMNGSGGLIGMTAVGVFASPRILAEYQISPAPAPGLIYGGGRQLGAQALGAGCVALFPFVVVAAAALLLRRLGGLRVDPSGEQEGADQTDHGERAGGAEREPGP